MAVAPLQLPGYAQAGDINWQSLSDLGKTIGNNRLNNARNEALSLSKLPDGSVDYGKAAMSLASLGDYQGAQYLQSAGNRIQDQARQARLDERQTSRDAVDDRFREESLRLQKAAAARADADKYTIKEGVDANGNPVFYRFKTTGAEGVIPTGASPSTDGGNPFMSGPQGKLTENEGKAQGFADRMISAEGILSGRAAETGIGPVTPGRDVEGSGLVGRGTEAAASVPGVGRFANYSQTKEYQQFKQARDNFINAQLRRESGAAISPDEYKKADAQYFPIPGDSPEVIEQKRQNRADAVRAMGREGGRFYRPSAVPQPNSGGMRSTRPNIAPAQSPVSSRPITREQYDQLQSGDTFTAPDGSVRVKP